jgi:hypothetical protein
MTGTAISLDESRSAQAPRRSLFAQTLAVADLDRPTIAAAFALFHASYAGADRVRFEHDLAEKQHVILLYDRETRLLRGFSTVLLRRIQQATGPATVVFSGDTVIDPAYWGQKQLQLAFARLLFTLKVSAPSEPLYWFLISKGYRTYLLFANAFPHAIPRVDRPQDEELQLVLDRLAAERFGADYDAERGLVRYAIAHEHVREGVAPVTTAALRNPHVRFFAERNPGHADGDELACLADVRLRDLVRAVVRIGVTRARRALGVPSLADSRA